jgi:hypothetical protein
LGLAITEGRFFRKLFAYGFDPDSELCSEGGNQNLQEISTGGRIPPTQNYDTDG